MASEQPPVGAGGRGQKGDSAEYNACHQGRAMRWRAAINRARLIRHQPPGPDKSAAVVQWRDAVLVALDADGGRAAL